MIINNKQNDNHSIDKCGQRWQIDETNSYVLHLIAICDLTAILFKGIIIDKQKHYGCYPTNPTEAKSNGKDEGEEEEEEDYNVWLKMRNCL